jgi:hypothetical protein
MSNETENGLTVEKIKSYVQEFDGLSSLGDRLIMELPPEHNDVIVHAPVEIYKYLLAQLATIERDTAEECVTIATARIGSLIEDDLGKYRDHIIALFNLGETP